MTEIGNPDIIKAIRTLAISDNPKTRQTLYAALLEGRFFLPVEGDFENSGMVTLQQGSRVSLMQGHTSTGEPFILAFTDLDALYMWNKEGGNYMLLHASDLFPMLAHNNAPMLMLNIAGPVGGEFTPAEIAALAEGKIPTSADAVETQQVTGQTEVEIKPLTQKPSQHLVSQIQRALSTRKSIQNGYLFTMLMGDKPPMTMLGIQFAMLPENPDVLMRELTSAIPAAVVDNDLTLMILQGDILNYLQNYFKPVYQSKKTHD